MRSPEEQHLVHHLHISFPEEESFLCAGIPHNLLPARSDYIDHFCCEWEAIYRKYHEQKQFRITYLRTSNNCFNAEVISYTFGNRNTMELPCLPSRAVRPTL